MQAGTEDDLKNDHKEDELDEVDVQETIQACFWDTYEQDRDQQGPFAHLDSGMTSGIVHLDEATTRVENLHEHASFGIVPVGASNVDVDSYSGIVPHGPFHLEKLERRAIEGSNSASSVNQERCGGGGGGEDEEEEDAKLPALTFSVAAGLCEDCNRDSSPLPEFVDTPFATLTTENALEDAHLAAHSSDDIGLTPPPDSSHAPPQAPSASDVFGLLTEPFVLVNPSVEAYAPPSQRQPEVGDDSLARRRSADSSSPPDNRVVRQRIIPFQPTQEEIEAARRTSNRAVRDLYAWYGRLNELNEYRRNHGHCRVPQVDENQNNDPLGVWVAKQRSQRVLFEEANSTRQTRRTSMTQARIELLDSIGFDWGTRRGDAAWTAHYNELAEFRRANGHSNYPTRSRENPRLGRFVTEQRRSYGLWRQGQLVGEALRKFQERVELLESINFQWAMQGPEAGNEGARGQDGEDGVEDEGEGGGDGRDEEDDVEYEEV